MYCIIESSLLLILLCVCIALTAFDKENLAEAEYAVVRSSLAHDVACMADYNSQRQRVDANKHYILVSHVRCQNEHGLGLAESFMQKRLLTMCSPDAASLSLRYQSLMFNLSVPVLTSITSSKPCYSVYVGWQ